MVLEILPCERLKLKPGGLRVLIMHDHQAMGASHRSGVQEPLEWIVFSPTGLHICTGRDNLYGRIEQHEVDVTSRPAPGIFPAQLSRKPLAGCQKHVVASVVVSSE